MPEYIRMVVGSFVYSIIWFITNNTVLNLPYFFGDNTSRIKDYLKI